MQEAHYRCMVRYIRFCSMDLLVHILQVMVLTVTFVYMCLAILIHTILELD